MNFEYHTPCLKRWNGILIKFCFKITFWKSGYYIQQIFLLLYIWSSVTNSNIGMFIPCTSLKISSNKFSNPNALFQLQLTFAISAKKVAFILLHNIIISVQQHHQCATFLHICTLKFGTSDILFLPWKSSFFFLLPPQSIIDLLRHFPVLLVTRKTVTVFCPLPFEKELREKPTKHHKEARWYRLVSGKCCCFRRLERGNVEGWGRKSKGYFPYVAVLLSFSPERERGASTQLLHPFTFQDILPEKWKLVEFSMILARKICWSGRLFTHTLVKQMFTFEKSELLFSRSSI